MTITGFSMICLPHTRKGPSWSGSNHQYGKLVELPIMLSLRAVIEKAFLDELRCRNGNLNIVCGAGSFNKDEL